MRKIMTIVSGTLIGWLMTGAAMACIHPLLDCTSDINVKENISAVDVDGVLAALF